MVLGRRQTKGLLCLAVVLSLSASARAQDNTQPAKPTAVKGDVSDALPDLVELDPFGGVSLYGQINHGLGEKLENGGTGGGRVAANFSRWVGIELTYNFAGNRVRLLTPIRTGLPTFDFYEQNHYLALDPVINLRPRGSRFQPYISGGFGLMKFIPTKQSLDFATNPVTVATYQSGSLGRENEVAFNYGGGVKFHVSRYFGLRFDVRGKTLLRNPTFDLPGSSTTGVYIVPRNLMNGLDATVGFVFYVGRHVVPPVPAPIISTPLSAGDITGAGGTLCLGKSITLHSTASDSLNHQLKYSWKLNDAPQSADGPDFTFTPNNSGDFKVEVSVTDATDPKRTVTAGPRTVTVQDYTPPQITSVTATPSTLSCAADPNGAHSAALAGAATGSACGGDLTYKWTVSEGSVTNDTSANATFDGSNLNFESGGQSQTKTVTATFTATDATGKSATQTTTINVNCPPQFKRLPDIVFAKNNARVNNCGKRILIDQAAPAAGSNYDILLVAHRAKDEKETIAGRKTGRRGAAAAHTLDEQRALNAAAVLMNDTKTCASVDPTQVKIDVEGTDQTSDPQPGICGTSNLPPAQKERKGSATGDNDKERRVEVYLVPKASNVTPPAAKNVKPVPESVVKGMGCPK